jgi:hypothetical protein
MPELPQKKVGIVACSGEEMPEGTVTRLATLKVLESLRPQHTVTICLPLFLAGGQGDRAFARFYPTIAVDGCEKRCAARGTEMYSGKPAVSVVVRDVATGDPAELGNARRLSEAGIRAVDTVADRIARHVDDLLNLKWDRRKGGTIESSEVHDESNPQQATCSCGSGIPVQTLTVEGQQVKLIALPLIFARFREAGKPPDDDTASELTAMVKIYNAIPEGEEETYVKAIMEEYAAFCGETT